MKLNIRKIEKKDWKAMQKIYKEWRTERTFAVPEYVFSDAEAKQKTKYLLKNGINFVAEIGGQVCGIIECEQSAIAKMAHTINIHQFNVLKKYRRIGVADALMKKVICAAKKRKIKVLFLYVVAHNRPAISFYKQQGFVKTGRIKDQLKFGNKYFDNNIMCKVLA